MARTILRFIDPDTGTPRLNLNDPEGFELAEGGLRLGTQDIDYAAWLHGTAPGAIPRGPHRAQVEMLISVRLTPQPEGWDGMAALMTALAIELDRSENVLEFIPGGSTVPYLIDTYASPIPSLFRGQPVAPEEVLQDPVPMDLIIYRHPKLRGAGTHI